jgi:DNA-binding PadR family transcriptional regulator
MESSPVHIADLLPLRQPTFYILLSLASSEKHGYAILKSVEVMSGGSLKLSTGTLYEALARLVEQEWIERVDQEELSGRSRKAYRLTLLGRQVLRAETERMKSLVRTAQLHLKDEPNI